MLLQTGVNIGRKLHTLGFTPRVGSSFNNYGNTRQALKEYDPGPRGTAR